METLGGRCDALCYLVLIGLPFSICLARKCRGRKTAARGVFPSLSITVQEDSVGNRLGRGYEPSEVMHQLTKTRRHGIWLPWPMVVSLTYSPPPAANGTVFFRFLVPMNNRLR